MKTNLKSARHRIAAWVVGMSVAGVALAELSPLLISVSIAPDATTGNQTLTVTTDRMPKGWFSSKNALDRAKSYLLVSATGGATGCSTSKDGGSLNSTTDGTFTPWLNPQGKTDGYLWAGNKDLSAIQNHWWLHTHCDGTVEKHGCDSPIDVSVTATAYASNGTCHTYVNDAGQTVCASDTKTASLPAVQDDDVVDTGCQTTSEACKLDGQAFGACESACEARANAAKKAAQDAAAAAEAQLASCAKTDNACKSAARDAIQAARNAEREADLGNNACECTCKLEQLPVSCPQAQHCAN